MVFTVDNRMMQLLVFGVVGLVCGGLWRYVRQRDVGVTASMVSATLPWFGVVGALYGVQEAIALPPILDAGIRSPTAYLVVVSGVLALWLLTPQTSRWHRGRITGSVAVLLTGCIGLWAIFRAPNLPRTLIWNSVAVLLAAALTGLVWGGLLRRHAHTGIGWAAPSVVFAHILDATTTGVGLEILGTTEQNPVSATIISLGDMVAAGGDVVLFLVIKTTVASVLILLSSPSIGPPREQVAVLALAGGVGLAPAIHNIVLFTLTVG